MMKFFVPFALLAIPGAAGSTSAQTPLQEQTIVRAGSQPSTEGPEQYFTGKVRVDPVFAATADVPFGAAYVTFEPGARSAWHTHPAGQRLLVTAGVGRTSVWGGPVIEIKAGDAVWCQPGRSSAAPQTCAVTPQCATTGVLPTATSKAIQSCSRPLRVCAVSRIRSESSRSAG